MSNFDIFSMALKNMVKRKLRTFLTIFAVIIGSTAIIVMISFGVAINLNFEQSLQNMGDITTITIFDPNAEGGGNYVDPSDSSLNKKRPKLDDKSIATLKNLKNIVTVTPVINLSRVFLVSGKYVASAEVMGIDPNAMTAFGYTTEEGRLLNEDDTLAAVIGQDVINNFYNPNDRNRWRKIEAMYRSGEIKPIVDIMKDKVDLTFDESVANEKSNQINIDDTNKKPKPKPYKLNVVGKLEKKGYYENDYFVFMDINEVKKIKAAQTKYQNSQGGQRQTNTSSGTYESIMVKCKDINTVEASLKEIEDLGFYANNSFKYLGSMKETSQSLQLLLGLIGGVSLFVAAIGISNTMIMAIYERTKEIGIMKVIGASIKDIKKLFLLEAALIGLIGGVGGILLSYLVSFLTNKFGIAFISSMSFEGGGKASIIPSWLALSALGFTAAIGLISGYFPARRAMKLSALKAIRTE